MSTTSLSTKTGSGKGLTLTDDELIVRLRERGCWYDYADKSTWFQDVDLTIPALQPEDVRYVKNKVGLGCTMVERIEMDSHGQYYIECGDNFTIYGSLLSDKPMPLSDVEAIEQRFMQDMKIYQKVQ